MASIALDSVRRVFPGGQVAIAGVTLSIADGERLAVVGPSGSGKSTLLRLIAGLESPSSGRIRIGDVDVTELPPERRDLAMVFQNYALYPHQTVHENLAFGLRMRRVPRATIDQRVRAVAASLGLDALLSRRPAALSGGQRQRVALGRAIIRDPRAFLFDEPLSNLDPRLRGATRAELVALHQRLGATMVYVTHDQEEAMTLGQRIAVLRDGRLEQVAPPDELYARPENLFVAQFIGSPPMNVLAGRLAGEVVAAADAALRAAVVRDGLSVGVRPHDLALAEAGASPAPGAAALPASVALVEPLGHAAVVHLDLEDGSRVSLVAPPATRIGAGAKVALRVPLAQCHFFGPDGRRREPRARAQGTT
jgi:ABC-type sugar transport system ATPase subunit